MSRFGCGKQNRELLLTPVDRLDTMRRSFGEKVYCAAVERDRLSNRNILKWKQFTLKLLSFWDVSATFGG